jgi:hypothetical protein
MSFDISKTPTLEAVANADEQVLAHDLQQRVAEALSAAEQNPDVAAAAQEHRTAAERLENLRTSQRTLNQYAKDARERLSKATQTMIDSIVESSVAKGKPEFAKANELAAIENHSRYANRAIEQLAEHLIPLGQIASLRAESHALLGQARAIERIAQARAEKLLTRMREAVSDEMVLPVDLSKGVAGALLAHANGLKRRAIQISESADEMERNYTARRQSKEGRV